jgi:hypothetical protein
MYYKIEEIEDQQEETLISFIDFYKSNQIQLSEMSFLQKTILIRFDLVLSNFILDLFNFEQILS